MAKFILFLGCIVISFSARASLPDWFEPSARRMVIDDFFGALKSDKSFYKVTNISIKNGKLTSGQEALFIDVTFDDSKGCSNRIFASQCTPITEGQNQYIGCFEELSDCYGKNLASVFKTSRIK